jgi:Glycosyltransferase family 87
VVAGARPTRYRRTLWGLLAAGLVIRLALTATTAGDTFDLGSLLLVAQALVHEPSRVYALANLPGQVPRWPYLPGYFPVILLVKGIGGLTGLGFEKLIRIPSALADLGIAWVVQDHLRARGADRAASLGAAALVALGPSFIAISGVHGQIDQVAILPATIALSVWERDRPERRAWLAGLLIGLGAAIKVVPALMLFALLPSARSRREAATLVGAALVAPAIAAAPMVAAAGTGWISTILHYHGGSGLGGLSLVAQPDLPLNWFHVAANPTSAVTRWLLAHGGDVAIAAILVAAAFVARLRVPAPTAAVLIWLTVYAFGVSFFMQYMVWGLPFFLMAGYRREVLGLQLLLLAPVLVTYHHVARAWEVSVFYVAPMLLVWLTLTVALGLLGRRVALRGDAQRAVQI